MAEYDLSPEDIFGRTGKLGPRGKKAAVKGARTPRPPKYRDPKTGKTWNGLGKPPAWIVGARNRDKYLIDVSGAGSDGAQAGSGAPAKKARKTSESRSRAPKAAARKTSKKGARKTAAEPVANADSSNAEPAA